MYIEMLTELVGGDKKKIPWRLRYVGDVDPLSDAPLEISMDSGSAICDPNGRNLWADYCSTCDWEIEFYDPRWRCMTCREVQCESCHNCFHETIHATCNPPSSNLVVVQEHMHPSMRRLEAASCNNLSTTLLDILQGFSERPCFCQHDSDQWMTYGQVLDRCLRLVQKLKQKPEEEEEEEKNRGIRQVALCFPAGSMEFYLWDIACILAGITTIGIHVPPPPAADWPTSISHVVCHDSTRQNYSSNIPTDLVWMDAQEALEATTTTLEPYDIRLLRTNQQDPDDAISTIYLTSGTTGKPKQIPQTRNSFRNDNFSSSHTYWKDDAPNITVSYLPPCWGTDRDLVYTSLHGGARIGFAPPSPTLPQIIETMEKIKPTVMVMVPTLAQFLISLADNKNKGSSAAVVGRKSGTRIGWVRSCASKYDTVAT
jgi:non-ribosomal peptide synthetase component F